MREPVKPARDEPISLNAGGFPAWPVVTPVAGGRSPKIGTDRQIQQDCNIARWPDVAKGKALQRLIDSLAHGFRRGPLESVASTAPTGVSAALWAYDLAIADEFASEPLPDCHLLSYRLGNVDCDMQVDGQTIHTGPSRPGSCSLIGAGGRTTAVLAGNWRTLTIFLPTAVVEGVIHDEATARAFRGGEVRTDGNLGNALLERSAHEILFEMRSGMPLARARIDCLGQDIVIQLLRAQGSAIGKAIEVAAAPPRLKRAMDYAQDRLEQDIGVPELATVAGVSAVHLTSLFRRGTGLPPHQWILERRLERARELLAVDGLSVAEVAAQCGFASPQHLSTCFRRHIGLTPSSYRRTLLL